MGTMMISDDGIYTPKPTDTYATHDWILARLRAIQAHARRIRAMVRNANDAKGHPSETFNAEQYGAVAAVREVGRRNGNYRGESFNDAHYARVVAARAESERRGE